MHQTYAPRLTLTGAVFPQRGVLRDVLLILAFSGIVALSARVSLPLQPVPVTLQTFAVLLTGAALGRNRGALALLAYLAEGLAGLPVFSGGASAWTPSAMGMPVILGPTGGYLVGFVAAAGVTGWLAEHGWDRSVLRTALAMVAGNLVIYTCGIAWLSSLIGVEKAVATGVLPFLAGDMIKVALAAAALPGAWRLVGRGS